MDAIATPVGPRRVAPSALVQDPEPLARALRHLLRRDGDYPALWRSGRFAAAVDAHRRHGVAREAGHSRQAAGNDGFVSAVSRLGTDPAAVALAIGHLEAGLGRTLPPWADLLRAGELARPSEVEIGTWFG